MAKMEMRTPRPLALDISMQDLPFRTATELTQDIKAGRLTARSLLDTYFSRVDRYNPALNALILQQRDQASSRADAADAALARGEDWGPLHGVRRANAVP